MANRYQDIGVARQIGSYSDAVEVPPNARRLVTAGTPGLALAGSLPKDITPQELGAKGQPMPIGPYFKEIQEEYERIVQN